MKLGNLKGKILQGNYKECFETRNSFQGASALTIFNEIPLNCASLLLINVFRNRGSLNTGTEVI